MVQGSRFGTAGAGGRPAAFRSGWDAFGIVHVKMGRRMRLRRRKWMSVTVVWRLGVGGLRPGVREANRFRGSRRAGTWGRSSPTRSHGPWPLPGSVAGVSRPWDSAVRAVAGPGRGAPGGFGSWVWVGHLCWRPFQRSPVVSIAFAGRRFLTLVCQPARLSISSISSIRVSFSPRQTDRPTRTWSSFSSSSWSGTGRR